MTPSNAALDAGASRRDRSDLGRHLAQCADARGRLHGLRCAADAIDAFLAPHRVTVLLLVTAGTALGWALSV